MSTIDYTVPSDLMIKNYNDRVNKLSSGKVNVIRSWKNPVGTGLSNVEFTMANRTKSIIPIMRYDLSSLVPINEDGYIVLRKSEVDAAIAALPNGQVALREKLLLASGLDPKGWWFYNEVELLWVMYGVFLSPTDYTTTNAYNLPDVDDWLAQTESYNLVPSAMTLVTATPESLGYTGQLKIITISENSYAKKYVKQLSSIVNYFDKWVITHPLASEGMEPLIDDILQSIEAVDSFGIENTSQYRLSELSLETSFVNNSTGGDITVTSLDDRATGTLKIEVSQSTENTVDLSNITNVDKIGFMEIDQPDFQIYDNPKDNAPRAKYLFSLWMRENYPELSERYSFGSVTSIIRTGHKTLDVVFAGSDRNTIGSVTVTFNFNNALHLSEMTNIDTPGVWEITDPNAVTNSYDWQDAMDELTHYIATKLTSQLQVSTINASVFKVDIQPNSNTPNGTASVILTPSETVAGSLDFFMDGELLVTYPDVGYVPKKEVNLSLLSNISEPGVWEIEAVNLEDFHSKVQLQKASIISIAFKNVGYMPSEWDIFLAKSFNSYRMIGTNSAPLIKGELRIYPYIK